MFEDDYSVSDRLWAMISDKFGFFVPLLIIRRPESLTILDYRPTFTMFLTVAGFTLLALSFVFLYFGIGAAFSVLLGVGAPAVVCAIFLFRGTIRGAYYFDRSKDSYAFVRQFIHRREVIEGSISQFTGAYVKTESHDDAESHFVVLKQEGMFLGGVGEQTLREELPMFNSFEREARIANAISEFLPSNR